MEKTRSDLAIAALDAATRDILALLEASQETRAILEKWDDPANQVMASRAVGAYIRLRRDQSAVARTLTAGVLRALNHAREFRGRYKLRPNAHQVVRETAGWLQDSVRLTILGPMSWDETTIATRFAADLKKIREFALLDKNYSELSALRDEIAWECSEAKNQADLPGRVAREVMSLLASHQGKPPMPPQPDIIVHKKDLLPGGGAPPLAPLADLTARHFFRIIWGRGRVDPSGAGDPTYARLHTAASAAPTG